ncbi:hypothetical protein CWR40_004270 [Cronobacter sakazakii]|nr:MULTISPECIES: hypothetical protein [Cronobacter]EIZ2434192.1 hypothetical protein [Cronobacter sakazakii]EIZ2458817.1 hypothetical protein [Cronobacter sakazakii]EJK7929040.1 hypothetical protein [Cronobacter sakazakii]EKY2006709.1 hypothetical protein [Cronobacter sakazakii]ELY4504298.1 hypothetical protein [Cronobacter sakazakii]
MKKALLAIVMATSALAITGCAPKPPSQVEISTANYGSLPSDYQQQIKNYMGSTLKDPESARYTFQPTYKGYSQDGAMASSGGKVTYGYVAPVLVNAKNSYGGYTGNHLYVFMFSNGVMYETTLNYLYGRVKQVP